jgi:DNA-binding FadR family transcriptional regulator
MTIGRYDCSVAGVKDTTMTVGRRRKPPEEAERGAGNLSASVTDMLGRRIVAGEIPPGALVPTEAAMCAALGVSRTTIREAVKRLHGKGLVQTGPRSGTRVLPTRHWNQFDASVLDWRVAAGVDGRILDQLYEIRECFEPRACLLAAQNGTDADREAISTHFTNMQAEDDDRDAHVAADLAFHLAIFAATQNLFFVSLGTAIRTALQVSFRLGQQRHRINRQEIGLHGEVCAAITRSDGLAAQAAMRALLAASRATLGMAIRA